MIITHSYEVWLFLQKCLYANNAIKTVNGAVVEDWHLNGKGTGIPENMKNIGSC